MNKGVFINLLILFSIELFICSCGTWTITPEIYGTWKSAQHKITVRTETGFMKYEFIKDSTFSTLTINENKTVDGFVGSAKIKNGTISTNWFLPAGMTGVGYTIECELIGKIFENDPLEIKDVEFWISPLKENISAELRYTQGLAKFPMAHINLFKKEN